MNQLFFDCEVCRDGEHHKCKHGCHEPDECKCIN